MKAKAKGLLSWYFRIYSGEGDQAYFSQINLAATKPKSPYFKGYFGASEQGL